MTKRIFSGMRPTGKLHLGHLVGALDNWIELQEEHECIFSVVNWHALMGEYEHSAAITDNIIEMAADWIASGLDPNKSIIYIQSHVPEHLELFMIFACFTPLGWLERNPTYKEQLREISTRDLHTYGFLGYPILQAADILLYKANAVPIGEDQLPHVELTREISRKFNHLYKTDLFADCEAILTETPRLLGVDNRKMSKSYNNAINLSDDEKTIAKKVKGMITDPDRLKVADPGHPDICNVYSYYKAFVPQKASDAYTWCTEAQKGCADCKKILAEAIEARVAPIREKRESLLKNPDRIRDILDVGAKKASAIAKQTLHEVKEAIYKS